MTPCTGSGSSSWTPANFSAGSIFFGISAVGLMLFALFKLREKCLVFLSPAVTPDNFGIGLAIVGALLATSLPQDPVALTNKEGDTFFSSCCLLLFLLQLLMGFMTPAASTTMPCCGSLAESRFLLPRVRLRILQTRNRRNFNQSSNPCEANKRRLVQL